LVSYEGQDKNRHAFEKKKKKKKVKRILPVAKRGGILPILPLLRVLGSLVSGAVGVAKAMNDNKAAYRQLKS